MMQSRMLAICAAGLLCACDRSVEPAQPVEAQATASEPTTGLPAEKVQVAKAALLEEPQIIDLVYDPDAAVKWTLGVKDDGSKRFGYAEYVCQRLEELGAKEDRMVVRIVDHQRYIEGQGDARAASLGGVSCNDGQRWDP